MVKVLGPMFSLHASGTLAGAVTYSSWKGRPYVRERVIPSNPKSGAQVGRRVMLGWLSQLWELISTANQATWDDIAEELVASPFNAYVGFNMHRWHNFLSPYTTPADAEAGNGSDRALTAAVWEENRIKLTATATTGNESWGMIIFGSTATPVVETVGTAIIVVADPDILAHDYFWTPPTVTTWYFDSMTFSNDGVLESAGGEQSAVPP